MTMEKLVDLGTELVTIDLDALTADLDATGLQYVDLDVDGQLTVLTEHGTVEFWQAMPDGSGADNTYWGTHTGGYEFCSSITHRAISMNPRRS